MKKGQDQRDGEKERRWKIQAKQKGQDQRDGEKERRWKIQAKLFIPLSDVSLRNQKL